MLRRLLADLWLPLPSNDVGGLRVLGALPRGVRGQGSCVDPHPDFRCHAPDPSRRTATSFGGGLGVGEKTGKGGKDKEIDQDMSDDEIDQIKRDEGVKNQQAHILSGKKLSPDPFMPKGPTRPRTPKGPDEPVVPPPELPDATDVQEDDPEPPRDQVVSLGALEKKIKPPAAAYEPPAQTACDEKGRITSHSKDGIMCEGSAACVTSLPEDFRPTTLGARSGDDPGDSSVGQPWCVGADLLGRYRGPIEIKCSASGSGAFEAGHPSGCKWFTKHARRDLHRLSGDIVRPDFLEQANYVRQGRGLTEEEAVDWVQEGLLPPHLSRRAPRGPAAGKAFLGGGPAPQTLAA